MVSLELATVPFKVVPSSEIYNSAEIQPNVTVDFQRNTPLREHDAILKRLGVAAPGQKIKLLCLHKFC